jgi:hypothetical protein
VRAADEKRNRPASKLISENPCPSPRPQPPDCQVNGAGYWAATRLDARREKVAQYFLEQAGYEVYLPKVRWRTRRRATRVSPLFPGYLFTRIELQLRDISRLPGVIKPVMSGEAPSRVPQGDRGHPRARA